MTAGYRHIIINVEKEVGEIPRYRHFRRYRQVIKSVFRHGFGHLLSQIGLVSLLPSARHAHREDKILLRYSFAKRLRLLLEELGPSFIKFGQLLSTRPDLLPRDVLTELSLLQDNVPSFDYSKVSYAVEEALDKPLSELFAFFEQEPLAAASIGQVHRAGLHTGEKVVVKVRRPGIVSQMETDLEILLDMARLAERHAAWARVYRVKEVVQELSRAIREELDYLIEAENARHFRENFKNRRDVIIPKVYWQFSAASVLVMEEVEGIKLNRPEQLIAAGHDLKNLARRLVEITFVQIFDHGFFHADPHPGNLALNSHDRLVLMDFGIAGRLKKESRRQFVLFLLGLVNRNPRQVVRALSNMGILSRPIDRKALRRDVERLLDKYLDMPLHKVELGRAVREILALAFEYNIRLPSEFALLGKAIMTLEGVIERLTSDLKLVELLQPYAGKLVREHLSPASLSEAAAEQLQELTDFLTSLPRRFNEALDRFDSDGIPLQLNYPDFEKALSHLARLGNRLTFSIALLSFSIIMAGLIIGSGLVAGITRETLLWRLPIVEVGFILAGLMAVWLLLAIIRSGRL